MKQSFIFLSLITTLCCLSSCAGKYYENSFFSNSILQDELLPNLPKPVVDSMVFVQRGALNKNRVYVDVKDETAEEYFLNVLTYTDSLAFENYGTIYSIKDETPFLGVDSSYYFQSTKMKSSMTPSDYYFEEEKAYALAYSNGEVKLGNNGVDKYLDDAHMIKVVDKGGTYQYDDFVYDYDYYIEFSYNPSLWFENQDDSNIDTGQFKLQIVDHTDRLITELSNSEGFYTPGRKLSFYFDPITEYEAEIAMYVNNKHHSFHKSITLSDREVWEITFEMTIKDTIIEFYIVQYMPVNN